MVSDGRWPEARLPFPSHRLIACGFGLVGIFIVLTGVWTFRLAQTTVSPLATAQPRAVVTRGIYKHTRNPMYLGMALCLAGVALWSAFLPGLVLVLLFCGYLTAFQIKPEERMLLARFGPPYAAYLSRVRRWL